MRALAAAALATFLPLSVWAQAPAAPPLPPAPAGAAPAAAPAPQAAAPPADEAPLPYTRELSADSVRVGEPVWLTLRFRHAGDVSLRMPDSVSFGGLELLTKERRALRGEDGAVSGDELRFELASYEPGERELPPLPFEWVDLEGREHRMEIPGSTITVRSMLANVQDQQPAAPRPPVPLVVDDYTLAWVGGILLALLLGAGLGYLGFRLWRRRPVVIPPPPPRPAEEVARERLAALRSSDLLAQGEVKEFYLELSGILREYLEGRFGIDATAMTSTEVLRALYDAQGRPREAPRELSPGSERAQAWRMLRFLRFRDMRAFFDEADIVQFARYLPSEPEILEVLEQVAEFVDLTTQRPEPATLAGPPSIAAAAPDGREVPHHD